VRGIGLGQLLKVKFLITGDGSGGFRPREGNRLRPTVKAMFTKPENGQEVSVPVRGIGLGQHSTLFVFWY